MIIFKLEKDVQNCSKTKMMEIFRLSIFFVSFSNALPTPHRDLSAERKLAIANKMYRDCEQGLIKRHFISFNYILS